MENTINRTDGYMKDALERIEQLEHQRRLKKRRKDAQKRKDDLRRYIIIGKLVCRYFPKMMKYQPQYSDAGNAKEFSDLEEVLAFVAGHAEFLEAVKKRNTERTL